MKVVNYLPILMLLGLVPPATSQDWDAAGARYRIVQSTKPTSAKPVQKVYPVADLVVPLHATDKSASANAAHLIKLAQMANPETWEGLGGCGKAEYYPLTHALVVSQTPEVQERIVALLESLRKMQDTQVVMEIHFVRVSDAFWERMGADMPDRNVPQVIRKVGSDGLERIGIDFSKPTATGSKAVIWNAKQVHSFLEAAQGDRRTNIMQAPKLTTFNGQTVLVEIGETHPHNTIKVEECKGRKLCIPVTESVFVGTRCETVAVAKENGKEVMLRFKAHVAEPVATPINGSIIFQPQTCITPATRIQSFAVDRTATIPNGCTLVLPAGTFIREERSECGPPVLSTIPYLNRLFRNVGYGMASNDVIVLVTPRILVQPATEVKVGSCVTGFGCDSLSGIAGSICATPCPAPSSAATHCTMPSTCCQTKSASMNLADVVALSSSGVSDKVIINQIQTTGAMFTLGTEDILWLKKNKVSDEVVMQMQHARAPQPLPMPTPVAMTPAMPMPTFPPSPYAPPQYGPPPMPQLPPSQYTLPPVPTPPTVPMPSPYLRQVDSFSPPLPGPGSLRPIMPGPISMPRIDFGMPPTRTVPIPAEYFQQAVPSPLPRNGSTILPAPRTSLPGEIGQQIVEAAAWLVDGLATLVAEDLPTVLAETGGTARPKVKLSVEMKLGTTAPAAPR